MMNFKNLTIDDKEIFYKYLNNYNFKTGEYCFSNLWLWKSLYITEYTTIDDCIIIKKKDIDNTVFFMSPIGYNKNNLKKIIYNLLDYSCSQGFNLIFKEVEEDFLDDIKCLTPLPIKVSEDIGNFDYIYLSQNLITLSGKKLHSKKNHYNYFVQNYSYRVQDLSDKETIVDCIDFLSIWCRNKNEISPYLIHEKLGIIDTLENFDKLNLKGIAVYINDQICGFSFGENINNKMALILVEKALPDIKGLYTFINKTLLETYFSSTPIINRQEDMGIEGLKKAKESYHPFKLEKKYLIAL